MSLKAFKNHVALRDMSRGMVVVGWWLDVVI